MPANGRWDLIRRLKVKSLRKPRPAVNSSGTVGKYSQEMCKISMVHSAQSLTLRVHDIEFATAKHSKNSSLKIV